MSEPSFTEVCIADHAIPELIALLKKHIKDVS